MQMFPWFGVLRNAKDEMSLMANAKYELMRDTKLQVLYEVQSTWYELYRIQKEISISEKNIEILKIIERLALVKYKSASAESSATKSNASSASNSATRSSNVTDGMQSMNAGQTGQTTTPASSSMQSGTMSSSQGGSRLVDIYAIQIEAGELENNIELLKSQQKTSIAEFNALLNRPLSAPVSVSDSLHIKTPGLNINAVSDSMMANNPMLGMLDYEKQSYEARKKMVSRMGLPMIGLGLNYSLINKSEDPMGEPEMNGKDMLMPMVAVTLPIYRKKYNAMKNESELLEMATSENIQSVSNSLQVEFLQAVQLYDDSWRRINLYEKQFDLASKTLDLVIKDFSSAAAELTEVLRVRQQTFDYELKQAKAVADYNTAVAWLRKLGNLEIVEINGNKWK
jgi:outer membrane protein TolC